MQKKSFIIRLFSTLLMCQILVFSVYGRTLSVKQAQHFGKHKCKIESPSEQQNLNSNIRLFADLTATNEQPDALSILSCIQNVNPLAFQFETPSHFKRYFYQILFEHFIAKNAP